MIKQAYDRDSVRQYVEAVRGALGSDQLRAATAAAAQVIPGEGDPQAKLSAALPGPDAAEPSSGGAEGEAVPYLSRDPAVSLVQSALEGALREHGVTDQAPADHSLWSTIVHTAEALLHPGDFSPDDPDWVIKIAESMLGRLAKGNHPFNPRPAEHAISDTARLVVVGDWGPGCPGPGPWRPTWPRRSLTPWTTGAKRTSSISATSTIPGCPAKSKIMCLPTGR